MSAAYHQELSQYHKDNLATAINRFPREKPSNSWNTGGKYTKNLKFKTMQSWRSKFKTMQSWRIIKKLPKNSNSQSKHGFIFIISQNKGYNGFPETIVKNENFPEGRSQITSFNFSSPVTYSIMHCKILKNIRKKQCPIFVMPRNKVMLLQCILGKHCTKFQFPETCLWCLKKKILSRFIVSTHMFWKTAAFL